MAYKVNIDAGHQSEAVGERATPFTKNVDSDGNGTVDVIRRRAIQ